MAGPARHRRPHTAASARILTAGLSSAAAFGMVAGMALTAAADEETAAVMAVPPRSDTPPVSTALPPAPQDVIVVVRRHWTSMPTPLPRTSPAPIRAATPPPAAQVPAPKPTMRPLTRTRGS